MDKFMTFMDKVPDPHKWPRWLRRTAILTLPVSFPLYLLAGAVWLLLMLAMLVVCGTILAVAELWK